MKWRIAANYTCSVATRKARFLTEMGPPQRPGFNFGNKQNLCLTSNNF